MVDDYISFKQDLLCKARCLPIEVITAVVNEYEIIIDSKRRSSCIKNFHDLILVLEKRCHVSSEDYSQLRNIVNHLSDKDKEIMLARLNNRRSVTYGDFYANSNGSQNESANFTNQEARVARDPLPPSALEYISSEIGLKWRDLARNLELREGDLNNLERQFPKDYKQCAYQSLLLYQSRYLKHDLRRNLLQALEKARRRDLQYEVELIFDRLNQ